MGLGRFVHHFGTLLLFVSFVLLLVVCITAPVVNSLSLMKVELGSDAEITFGTFGYCLREEGKSDLCTSSHIGYDPAGVLRSIDNTSFGNASATTAKGLTRVMVLHPVACGLAFISFLLCLLAGMVSSFLASMVAVVTFIVTLVAMICDFVTFSIVKHDVNKGSDSTANWGPGIWLMLVSAIFTLFGAGIVFVTCCCARKTDRAPRSKETWNHGNTAGSRWRRWK